MLDKDHFERNILEDSLIPFLPLCRVPSSLLENFLVFGVTYFFIVYNYEQIKNRWNSGIEHTRLAQHKRNSDAFCCHGLILQHIALCCVIQILATIAVGV